MTKQSKNIFLFSPGGSGSRMLWEWLKLKFNDINGQMEVHFGSPSQPSTINLSKQMERYGHTHAARVNKGQSPQIFETVVERTRRFNRLRGKHSSSSYKSSEDKRIIFPHPMVYLYADPCDTVMSFYRRGFVGGGHSEHLRKSYLMQEIKKELDEMPNPPGTLEEYIEEGKDLYNLTNHFHYYSKIPGIILVKYEYLWENLLPLLKLLGIPNEINDFPIKKERQGKKHFNLTKTQMTKFEEIYKNHKNTIEYLPPVIKTSTNIINGSYY